MFGWNTTHRKPACVYTATGNVAWNSSVQSCTFTPTGAWSKMAMGYDAFGNPTGEAVTASGGVSQARVTTMSYSTGASAGYFPISVTNPLNQIVRMTHDAREGNVIELVDVKGQTVRMIYDAFGREIERYFPVSPDGTIATTVTDPEVNPARPRTMRRAPAPAMSGWEAARARAAAPRARSTPSRT